MLHFVLAFVWILSIQSLPAFSQEPSREAVGRDAKAVAILAQAVSAAGAGSISAMTESGIITYFWAGDRVQGLATIRARGGDDFRLDASLPAGETRSVALSASGGTRKEAEGKLTDIPLHNRLAGGNPAFPYLALSAALADRTSSIFYVGTVDIAGRQAHQIRVNKTFTHEQDPAGLLSRLSAVDYFIDAARLLIVKTTNLTHPANSLAEDYPREVELEEYTSMNGVTAPTVVREKINGQTTWEFRLSALTPNSNFADADFSLR